ncbi:MAG: D-alanine--D-alanine ligase [Candidatus Kapaibacterium sp.]|jgi:D-alanine-D-alanine ligase
MNIAVLLGGNSPERNVSLASGAAVTRALRSLGHTVVAIDPSSGTDCIVDIDTMEIPSQPPTAEELAARPVSRYLECVCSSVFDDVEIAFSVLHGKNGEDGVMQALLEARGVRYTGSSIMGCSLTMDKAQTKIVFSAVNVPTPRWTLAVKGDDIDHEMLRELRDSFRNGIVVKPNDQGSTVGMTIITSMNLDDIEQAIIEAWKFSETALIEEYIEGRELTVAVVGDEAFPVVEIIPEGGFYDYAHKYTKGMSSYHCPADLDEELTAFIQNLSIMAHKACGCSGYSRIDFRLDEDNQPWCLEVNTLPGMTATSLVPKAAAAAGVSFEELCERIINLAR